MENPLNAIDQERHLAALRWGFRLFLGIEIIPFIVLFTLRYELVAWYVAPTVNQWLGAADAFVMLISMGVCVSALGAIRQDDLVKTQHRLKATVGLGLVYMALLIYEWSQRSIPVGTRFGENFYSSLGVSAFYTLAGLFVLVAVAVRSGRARLNAQNYWDIQAVTWYWVFQGFAAIACYLLFYWI
ncbi:cytochrome c oxidase subunit 3 [Sulfobacillus harzensis]|uniref:Heme-copper oxidase subunit III family profile domain-containing protein n=1 Tax=Sulfobacillus harzensis TaxID=2729629 RepID=A0A7Y0L455_9FIRM|nr:hypothetical protein [Sulfobacillus harzensis]NMP22331.1 hypothetical protein [Sulfobacillus harzensis]